MRELEVRLDFGVGDERPVGVLVEDGRRVWLQVDAGFAAAPLPISPYALPLGGGGLIEHPRTPGVPLPGVFGDSRPDGWGLMLLHRLFQQEGVTRDAVSPMDELAFLGSRTMGALTYHPCTAPSAKLNRAFELATLAQQAQRVFEDHAASVLPDLVRAGGSPGGARPKALIGMPDDGPGVCLGGEDLPKGWQAWIVKFPKLTDDIDVGRRERAWMRMAEAAGIEVPNTRVLPLAGVGDAFAVRRFDRAGGRRLHMLSAAGAMDADFVHDLTDYETLLRLTGLLCDGDQSQVLAMYRLAVFNVATVNQDDHLKNVAWLMDATGAWRLAPGFDLTYAPVGTHSTSVMGRRDAVGRSELLELAAAVGIRARVAKRVLGEVLEATTEVASFVGAEGCDHPVTATAIKAVLAASARC